MAALSVASLLAGNATALAAPREYPIGHFSNEFRATVTVEDSAEVFRSGAISVFERRTGRRLLRVTSSELAFEVEAGEVQPDLQALPSGRQSVLVYEDFDFDGRPDLAIMDGQKSCYHGPSFQVFLRRGQGFRKSAAFTRLAQRHCGMFTVDARAKRLFTVTKSGCCSHERATWDVVGHAPHLLVSVKESFEPQ
jgi:hypothetical protein